MSQVINYYQLNQTQNLVFKEVTDWLIAMTITVLIITIVLSWVI